MRRPPSLSLKAAIVVTCLVLVPVVALAGKPASGPVLLTGTGGYVAQRLFDSEEVLTVVRGEDAWNPVNGFVSMSGAYDLRLTFGLEVDDIGAVYAVFRANGDATGGTHIFSGVVRYDDDTEALEVVLARSLFYEEPYSESNQGEHIWRIDRVPAQIPSATGDLQSGDFIVTRWADTTDVNDSGSSMTDDRFEIVLFRSDASGELVEERVLYAHEDLYEAGAVVAADNRGNVYVWLSKNVHPHPMGLYRISYNATMADYDLTPVTFPFETNQHFDTDDAGSLYVQGAFGSTNAGVIYRLAAGGNPQTDTNVYATYSDAFGVWTANNAATNGALAMFLRRSSKQPGFVGLAASGSAVAYADRIGDTASAIYGITSDAYGSVYVAHEDRTQVSRTQYALEAYTIYRVELDTSSGGGDTGGGGNGNGKGKNK